MREGLSVLSARFRERFEVLELEVRSMHGSRAWPIEQFYQRRMCTMYIGVARFEPKHRDKLANRRTSNMRSPKVLMVRWPLAIDFQDLIPRFD